MLLLGPVLEPKPRQDVGHGGGSRLRKSGGYKAHARLRGPAGSRHHDSTTPRTQVPAVARRSHSPWWRDICQGQAASGRGSPLGRNPLSRKHPCPPANSAPACGVPEYKVWTRIPGREGCQLAPSPGTTVRRAPTQPDPARSGQFPVPKAPEPCGGKSLPAPHPISNPAQSGPTCATGHEKRQEEAEH